MNDNERQQVFSRSYLALKDLAADHYKTNGRLPSGGAWVTLRMKEDGLVYDVRLSIDSVKKEN